ncbi:MAG: cation diffusion facilitator family transporter [Dehalococcoidia bacterium]|nr:cation diffusion facilitator family transporter [Dehalococcoidia bacterium]
MFDSKKSAATLALGTVLGLFALKLAAAALTGSASILAQMADSLLDILSVGLTYVVVIAANRPADAEHPFGHGKLESVSAAFQAILIFATGGAIVYNAVQKLVSGAEISRPEMGVAVMIVAALASVFLSRKLGRTAQATDSPALSAIVQNIRADVYSAAAVLSGMAAIYLSRGRLAWLDPALAIAVSLLIFRSGFLVLKQSFSALIDVRLPTEEEQIVCDTIMAHNSQLVGVHALRSRKSGSQRYVDLHLVMPKDTSVAKAHEICDHLEQDLAAKLAMLSATIHVEPCDNRCSTCGLSCGSRQDT